jgi:hypothetical protein
MTYLRENNISNSSNFDISNLQNNSLTNITDSEYYFAETSFLDSHNKLELYATIGICSAFGFAIGTAIGLVCKSYYYKYDYYYTEIN